MNEVYFKDLGIVTAYGYALSKGYTGTEEQFATLMADYATIGQQAVDAALAAEGYAVGTHDGEPVPSTDPAYHNNAKYYAKQIAPALNALDYALAAFPTATLTDQTIASFSDGADGIPVKDLVIDIAPNQEGSGDPTPDNVRPINGSTSRSVTRTGKNLYINPTAATTSGGITFTPNADGSITLEGDANTNAAQLIISLPFRLVSGTAYTISLNNTDTNEQVGVRLRQNKTGESVKYGTAAFADSINKTLTLTVPSNWEYANQMDVFVVSNHDAVSPITLKVQIEFGNEATAWEKGIKDTYSISWEDEAGTVYGGTLDFTTGVLTVTHKVVTWPKSSSSITSVTTRDSDSSTAFWGNISDSEGCNVYGTGSKALCSAAKKGINSVTSLNLNEFGLSYSYQGSFFMRFAQSLIGTTAASIKSYFLEHPIQFYFKKSTPQTYQLTPTEVKTLLGNNNVGSYYNYNINSLVYRADPTMYIDGKVNSIMAAIAALE